MKDAFLLCCLLVASISVPRTWAQTTAFSYQGRLFDSGAPATGLYDLQFRLADAASDGNFVGLPQTNACVPVNSGLFTVLLDFGGAVFDGSGRWLEIWVRTNGSTGVYTTLSPRQPVTVVPYAVWARTAAMASNLVAGASIVGNGAGLSNINGASIQSGTVNLAALDPSTRASLSGATGSTRGGKLIIIEDDWPTDMDNIFEIDYGLKLMDQGLLKILATPYAGYGGSNALAVPLIDALCRYYGHPEILQGASGAIANQAGTPSYLWYDQPFPFSADIVTNFHSAFAHSTNYPSARSIYRSILENSPNGSVTLLFGGPLANLWDLWRSGPDAYSLSSGAQLISNKVAEIICALGSFPTNVVNGERQTDNLNFGSGSEIWSWMVLTNMGVPVTFMPLTESGTLPVINNVGPAGTVINRPHTDPSYMVIRDWIYYWHGSPLSDAALAYQGVAQWTTMAVLYAAYGTNYCGQPLFDYVPGNMYWRPGPYETWLTNATANGNQRFLVKKQPDAFYHNIFSNAFGCVHSTYLLK